MKNLLRFIAFVLMVGSAYAQSVLPACPPLGYFHNCFGTFTYSSGMKYVGEWRDDKYNGQGVLFYANGSTRQGVWADGVIIRSATVQLPLVANQVTNVSQAQTSFGNLPVCQGNDVSKWSNCFGSKTDPSGTRYVGEFRGGKRNGQGTFIFANGNKYVGEWMEDKYNGLGAIYASTGAPILEGIWSDDRFVRSVPLQQTSIVNQTSATAAVQPNIPTSNLPACQGSNASYWSNCFGMETNAGGTKFIGEFISGRKHGKGQYIWENGDKFVGDYFNNQRNGLGIDYLANGQIKDSGTFKDGRLAATHYVDPKLYPFNSSIVVAATQVSMPDPVKAERDRLASDLEASRKKQQELEEQLRASQVTVTQNSRPAQNMSTERRVALVIGNATYKVNPLKNPVNDSTDMARSLRSVGFDVIEANNTTLAQMREVTRRFADKLGSSDVGLVYYSGHGVEVKGKNYLIPVNADIKREYEVVDQAFDASQFLEMMDNIRGPNNKRVNILIVDACRNNELQRSWRSTNNGLARMDAPGGTFISFATAPGRVAADGAGRNSPYTKHLLQALKQPNVPIEQVFKVVRRNVMEETKGEQIPWENSSLVGDFYFTVQR